MAIPPLVESIVVAEANRIHAGPCPACGGPGPVDYYKSHWVQSYVVITRFGTHAGFSCRPCRNKQWLKDTTTTVATGWWGLHGAILTPVQLVKNAVDFYAGPTPARPSKRMLRIVHKILTAKAAAAARMAASSQCASCGASYLPTDYDPDAAQILCRRCDAPLPKIVK